MKASCFMSGFTSLRRRPRGDEDARSGVHWGCVSSAPWWENGFASRSGDHNRSVSDEQEMECGGPRSPARLESSSCPLERIVRIDFQKVEDDYTRCNVPKPKAEGRTRTSQRK